MFRILFFILFIGFLIFGFMNLTQNISNDLTTDESYIAGIESIISEYSSGSEDSQTTDYVLYSAEFMGDTSWDSNTVSKTENYFARSEFNEQYSQNFEHSETIGSGVKNGGSNINIPENTVGSSLGDSDSLFSFSDENCSGIFYDPCLKIGNLDTQSGDFKLIASGTPIYTEVEKF